MATKSSLFDVGGGGRGRHREVLYLTDAQQYFFSQVTGRELKLLSVGNFLLDEKAFSSSKYFKNSKLPLRLLFCQNLLLKIVASKPVGCTRTRCFQTNIPQELAM